MFKSIFKISSFLLVFSTSLQAGPISLFGIDWSMSLDEMTAVFKKKGYTCGVTTAENDYVAGVTWCAQCEYKTVSEKLVTIKKDRIFFNCQVFNGCELRARQVAQSLINQGRVRSFTSTERRTAVPDKNGLPTNKQFTRQKFIGKGELGDKVAVIDSWDPVIAEGLGRPVAVIFLDKDGYADSINFD